MSTISSSALHPPPGIPFHRSLLYWASTLLFTVGLGTAFWEVVLQFTWSPPSERETRAYERHDIYGWAPRPGVSGVQVSTEFEKTFRHNDLGLRGRSPLDERGESTRILVLGDSHAYGRGCSNAETFAEILDAGLSDAHVVNAGCNGYGTAQELQVLELLGRRWRPDVVLLLFFWNDLEDNLAWTPESRPAAPPAFDPLEPRVARERKKNDPSLELRLPKFLKEGLRGLRYRTIGISARDIRTPAEKEEAWRVTEPLLASLAEVSREIEATLVVACLPDYNQVDPDAVIRNISPLNYDVQERLARICDDLDVEYLDLLPPLRAAFEAGEHDLFYYADRHMTPGGQRVVANVLLSRFGSLGR